MQQKADKGIKKTEEEQKQLARVLKIWDQMVKFDDIAGQRPRQGKWR